MNAIQRDQAYMRRLARTRHLIIQRDAFTLTPAQRMERYVRLRDAIPLSLPVSPPRVQRERSASSTPAQSPSARLPPSEHAATSSDKAHP